MLKEHKIKAAKLFWKSTYGKQYVPTLAVPLLKSQEIYQDSLNKISDSSVRIWLFWKGQEPSVVEGILKGIFWGRVMEWQVPIGFALAVSSISSFVPAWFAIALLHSLPHSLGDYWLSVVILVSVLKSALGEEGVHKKRDSGLHLRVCNPIDHWDTTITNRNMDNKKGRPISEPAFRSTASILIIGNTLPLPQCSPCVTVCCVFCAYFERILDICSALGIPEHSGVRRIAWRFCTVGAYDDPATGWSSATR